MAWIAENPQYDGDDRRLLKYLKLRTTPVNAQKIVNVFSLYKHLESQKFGTAKDIETSAYYDAEKTRPVFTPKLARSVFSVMKKRGGAGDEAIVLDRILRNMITYLEQWFPPIVGNTINGVYSYIIILKTLKQIPGIGMFVDIGIEAFVQGTKTTVVAADLLAAEAGGPPGAAAIAIPSAIAVAFVAITHLLDDELGEALLVTFLAVPFIGPILYKAAGSLGRFSRKVFRRKDDIVDTTRMVLGDGVGNTVQSVIPNMNAGKRFSTRRRKIHKWRRTRSATR